MSLARLLRARLSESQICELREAFARIVDVAPTFRPVTPGGSPMSVAITNAGSLGWTSTQRDGYHYTTTHPTTGLPWPPIPELLRELWSEHACATIEPECCLVNLYRAGSKLGLHVDRDEPAAADVPILSVSIGAPAVLRVGGRSRKSPTETMIVRSGDVLVFAGDDRHVYHGIDRALVSPSEPARINFTLRRVSKP